MAITYEELREMHVLVRDIFMLKRMLETKKAIVAGAEIALDEATLGQLKSVYDAKVARIKQLTAKLSE